MLICYIFVCIVLSQDNNCYSFVIKLTAFCFYTRKPLLLLRLPSFSRPALLLGLLKSEIDPATGRHLLTSPNLRAPINAFASRAAQGVAGSPCDLLLCFLLQKCA
jgi:hypothetical protein